MSRKIQNKPTLNQTVTQKNLVGELEREQDRLRAQLAAQRSKVGVYLPTEQYEEEKARLATLEARVQAFDDIMVRKDTELEEKLAKIKSLSEQIDRVRGELEKEKIRVDEERGVATAHKAYGLKLRNDAKDERHEVERLLDVVERMDEKRGRMSCALESRVEEAMQVRKRLGSVTYSAFDYVQNTHRYKTRHKRLHVISTRKSRQHSRMSRRRELRCMNPSIV